MKYTFCSTCVTFPPVYNHLVGLCQTYQFRLDLISFQNQLSDFWPWDFASHYRQRAHSCQVLRGLCLPSLQSLDSCARMWRHYIRLWSQSLRTECSCLRRCRLIGTALRSLRVAWLDPLTASHLKWAQRNSSQSRQPVQSFVGAKR